MTKIGDGLCSQHFKYGSNYDHVTFGIQKFIVEPEAVSQVKKLMIYGCLHGPGQIYSPSSYILYLHIS